MARLLQLEETLHEPDPWEVPRDKAREHVVSTAIRNIARETDRNGHNRAIKIGCTLLYKLCPAHRQDEKDELEHMITDIDAVMRDHQRLGHMSGLLIEQRRRIGDRMDELAFAILSPEELKEFNGAF